MGPGLIAYRVNKIMFTGAASFRLLFFQLAQFSSQQLAQQVLGKRVCYLHGLGHLEGGQLLPAVCHDLFAADLFVLAQHAKGLDLLAVDPVRDADDAGIALLAERWRGKRVTFGLKPGADLSVRRIGQADPGGVGFVIVIGRIATRLIGLL